MQHLMMAKGEAGPTEDMVETLGEWQNSALPGEAKKLKKQPWPAKFRQYSGTLYRVIALSDKNLMKCIENKMVGAKKPSSWTKDMKVIREFMGDYFFSNSMGDAGDDSSAVLLTIKPKHSDIILDVDSIWKDKSWCAWIEHFNDQRKYFSEGLEFRDSQQEVILDIVNVPIHNVQVMTGWSNHKFISTEQYVKEREKQLKLLHPYGR